MKGWHVLAMLVAFFGVVISVNILMAVLATTSWSGLVAKNGYIASIDYSEIGKSHKALKERGWTVALEAPGGIVRLDAHDADGAELPIGHEVTAEPFGHLKDDTPIRLVDGPFGLHAEEPLSPGRYIVRALIGPDESAIDFRAAVEVTP